MKDKLPDFLQNVIEEYPDVWKAYQALGEACGTAGPLEAKTARLVKLALSHRREIRRGSPFARSASPPRRHHARGVATSLTACRDFYRLVCQHGCPLLDPRCC